MNAITILEKELKRVRKIGYRLATKEKGSIPEKDMERYQKEVTENNGLEKDLIDAIGTIKSNSSTKKVATAKPHWDVAFEIGRTATIPWDGWMNDAEERRIRLQREFESSRDRLREQMSFQWLPPATRVYTSNGAII